MLGSLDKHRAEVTKQMAVLANTDPEQFLNGAIDCHLRQSTSAKKHKDKCKLCEVREDFLNI